MKKKYTNEKNTNKMYTNEKNYVKKYMNKNYLNDKSI